MIRIRNTESHSVRMVLPVHRSRRVDEDQAEHPDSSHSRGHVDGNTQSEDDSSDHEGAPAQVASRDQGKHQNLQSDSPTRPGKSSSEGPNPDGYQGMPIQWLQVVRDFSPYD